MKKHSNVLITGAHGFIGSRLTEILEEQGHTTFAFPRLNFLHDVKDLAKEISPINPDYIFHLASYGNMANQKDINEIFFNIHRVWKLLRATKDIPYQAFINIGTSSEYGKKQQRMIEEMVPETDTFYGATKVSATYLCRAFAKQFCKPIVTVRPFSVYGPGEADFRFIPQIIKHLQEGITMNVDTQGNHDWIYIDDFISGMLKVADNAAVNFGEVVNIGTGFEYNNEAVIGILEEISGKKLQVNIFDNTRPNDSKVWVDGSMKLRDMGWRPKFSLSEGLEKTYDYFKNS